MGSQEIKDVMIVGGGGNLGPSIIDALSADSNFVISVLARENSTSTYPSHVTVHRIDESYPQEELLKVFKGRDALICALSPFNLAQQISFIDVAVQVGVKWFIPAEFGGNKAAAKHGERLPLHDVKEHVLEHLAKMESKGLSWTAIATGPFLDWGIENGFLGFNIKAKKAKIYGSGDERWTGANLSTIGLAVARLLQNPQQFQNQFIYVYSVATSQNEILASLEKVTGTKWDTEHIEWEDEIPIARQKLKSGDRMGASSLILSYFYRPGMGADYTRDVEAANEALGLPTETIENVVTKAVS